MKISKSNIGLLIVSFFIFLSISDLLFPSKGDDVNRVVPQIGRAIFFFLMLITIIRIRFKNVRVPQPITGVGMQGMIFIFFFVSLFSLNLFIENIVSMIKIFYWICGYYFFYYALVTGLINSKHIKYFTIAAVFIYFLTVSRDYSNQNLWRGSKEFFVSNNSYHLLKCFPLVLLFRNKFKNLLILLIVIGLIFSFKRGALLAFTLAFLLYYLYIFFKENTNRFSKLIFGILVILIGGYYFESNADVFAKRMEDFNDIETAGSGRGNMFGLILYEMFIVNSDPVVLLFGNGPYATLDFFQESIGNRIVAHSDVLEFLYDFGLIGFILFLFFFYRVFKLYLFFKNEYYGLVILVWLITIFISSMYSVNLFAAEMIYAILPIVFLESERVARIYNYINISNRA